MEGGQGEGVLGSGSSRDTCQVGVHRGCGRDGQEAAGAGVEGGQESLDGVGPLGHSVTLAFVPGEKGVWERDNGSYKR